MDKTKVLDEKKIIKESIECGYYYLTIEVCRNIIIAEGLSGVNPAQAIEKIRLKITGKREEIDKVIPVLRTIDQDIISYYAWELAESIVKAARKGKGVAVVIGYPKILVISII